jgi:TRAP-type mannitol/chloroaromatic compound transport system substrate-binding protein
MNRRDFLGKTAVAAGAVGAVATTIGAPAVWAQGKKYHWKMVTTWPPNFPVLQVGAERFAKRVKEATEGRITIDVFAGGELVPALGCFDAVSAGTVELFSGAAYYWAGKVPSAQWFSSVPFGLNPQGINTWFYAGEGLKLWEECYAPFNLVPRPQGNTGVQMGGWFRKEMNTMADWKGLKMRIPGLGGKVVAKAGGTVVLLPGGEIFTSLERGVIDAVEWVGPLHDLRLGLYKAAQYYYYPGWHEPGTCLEVTFNKKVYDGLPSDLKTILDSVAAETNIWSLSEFESSNGAALEELINQHHVQLKEFPAEMLVQLGKLSAEVLEEEAAKDPQSKKVNEAFKKFRSQIGPWGTVSEKAYYDRIFGKYALKTT